VQLTQRALQLGQYSNRDQRFALAGVWGMGGVGKTTLALAVHDAAAQNFEGRASTFALAQNA